MVPSSACVARAGVVAGAVMTTYLLEKSRVVFQGPQERNYHALYMLQQGAEAEERRRLQLQASCNEYSFLNSSGCVDNPEWGDDAEEYRVMRKAMGRIGLPEETQRDAMAVLAGVMHMGNVGFASDAAEEYAAVATTEVMARVSLLMGCDDVSTLVLQRTMKVPGAVYNIQLTPLQAQAARNAFGKAVYCLLFDWVVARVNDSIRGAATDAMAFIGLLDVFGFEIFQVNSFEQAAPPAAPPLPPARGPVPPAAHLHSAPTPPITTVSLAPSRLLAPACTLAPRPPPPPPPPQLCINFANEKLHQVR